MKEMRDNMLPLRFVGILVILLATQAWCKPAKNSEDGEYNDDDPQSEYNDDDTVDDEDDPSAVEEPPQIISKSESVHVRNGSTIWLHCLVKNAENFAITWKKDDAFLYYDANPMNADKRVVRLPNNTLVIYNATTNDTSDNYECSILYKPVITIKHRVLVDSGRPPVPPSPVPSHKQPLIHVTPGKRVEVSAGGNITLGCETRMQPAPEIKWYHENKRVHNNVVVFGNYITITQVSRHDGGRYQCLAEDDSGQPPVEAINVIVNYAPEIETKGKWVHTGLGFESRLTCIVHAHPHAKVAWFKGQDEVLPVKGSVEMKGNKTRHVLEILHTEKNDFGEYTCTAENAMGRASKSISLAGTPSQATIIGNEMAKSSSGLTLKWQLESYSPITEYRLQYRHKGQEEWTVLNPAVTNGKGNQFVVEHTIEDLELRPYEAVLLARNDLGWSLPSKPYTFIGEHGSEVAENVKGSSAASQPVLTIATLVLVVSSCAFTSL